MENADCGDEGACGATKEDSNGEEFLFCTEMTVSVYINNVTNVCQIAGIASVVSLLNLIMPLHISDFVN